MKHLFLKDDELVLMVFYPPKKKAKMYETIFEAYQQQCLDKRNGNTELYAIECALQKNGFKVVNITTEIKDTLNIYKDLTQDTFVYRGVLISQSMYSTYSFWVGGKTFNTCFTIEEAIATIDKELDNAK